jgi:hypothetical protein
MSINNLQVLRNNIEKLDKVHHINILEILEKNSINYSENTNGIFINLTNIEENIINKINNYVKYVKLQELELDNVEDKKKEYVKEFYNDNKECLTY